MFSFLYNKISFFLINLSLARLLMGLYFSLNSMNIFLEWTLGGSLNNFTCTFYFDSIALFFLFAVLFISRNVVLYSCSYIGSDFNADRFIYLVFAFVVSIMLLITSPNIVRILLGWDGLGLVSYCLVIYYPTHKSNRAGMLTVLRNRVGDVCILLVIAYFASVGDYVFYTWSLSNINILSNSFYLTILITLGAMTKSAQIPFSAWLPAAMAAPTPVSALVHSSTLVTAGVYLLIRFGGALDDNGTFILLFLSSITMFISGLAANFEYDLKKIIALSTLSQLGVMMFSISLGLHTLAFFHLITHALFKALLFLCAGTIIHGDRKSVV